MKLLSVIPISRGINKENLTYFTSSDIAVGSVVKIPLRKKIISGIVVSAEDVAEAKAEIKNASFETRKVEKIKSSSLLSTEFMSAIAETATYFTSTSGGILNSLIPKAIIENAVSCAFKVEKLTTNDPNKNLNLHEKLVVQNDDEERSSPDFSLRVSN